MTSHKSTQKRFWVYNLAYSFALFIVMSIVHSTWKYNLLVNLSTFIGNNLGVLIIRLIDMELGKLADLFDREHKYSHFWIKQSIYYILLTPVYAYLLGLSVGIMVLPACLACTGIAKGIRYLVDRFDDE